MKAWKVGGAVRDAVLGRASGDTDWVVTGATPEQMVAAGYTPVGRDFPVFLHPTTKEEYALARTERSTAPGYHGFVFHTAPDVTLEQDLQSPSHYQPASSITCTPPLDTRLLLSTLSPHLMRHPYSYKERERGDEGRKREGGGREEKREAGRR